MFMLNTAAKKLNIVPERQESPEDPIKPRVDYFVYGYVHPDIYGEQQRNWVKILKTRNRRRALNKAKRLHQKKAYQKIEIKKHTFDPYNKKSSSAVLKIYQHLPGRNLDLGPFILLALMCCFFAFLAGHYVWL